MDKEELSLFTLAITPDIGAVRFFKLLEVFGSASNILSASKDDLMTVDGIGNKIAQSIKNINNSDAALKEIELAEKNNIDIVLYTNDKKYPAVLNNYPDKPLVLYIKGEILDRDYDSISIVGSRKITNYGKTVTKEFAEYFARLGITIISGLARGVDTYSHIAAIENKSRTIAILGNGLLVNYPPENSKLQSKIPENGALISEYPLFQNPDKTTFPRRNRIISGLSKATLVTEAAKYSGALISAKYAAEYGKDVFAVPGNIYSSMSQGSNFLIQTGAYAVTNPKDMAELLNFADLNEEIESSKQENAKFLGEKEKAVLQIIEESPDGIMLDLIVSKLNSDFSEITAIILNLELNDLIESAPGQVYIRKR